MLDLGSVARHMAACGRCVNVHEHGTVLTGTPCTSRRAACSSRLLQPFDYCLQLFDVDRTHECAEDLGLVFEVHFLGATGENDVIKSGCHHGAGLVERRGGAGAGVLDVDHGHSTHSDTAQHDLSANALLTRQDACRSVRHPRRLNVVFPQAGV